MKKAELIYNRFKSQFLVGKDENFATVRLV